MIEQAAYKFGISESKRYYRIYHNMMKEVFSEELNLPEKDIMNLLVNPLFHHSYDSIAFFDRSTNSILAERMTNFSSFYPSAHFDFLSGIEEYIHDSLPFPAKLFINPTNKCNYRCQVCSFNPTRKQKGFNTIPVFTLVEILNLLKEYSPHASVNISGGGEPTLYKDIEQVLHLIQDTTLKAFLTTNGSKIEKQFWELVVKSTSVLVFSIRGLSTENYHVIENPMNKTIDIDQIIRTIQTVIELREKFNRSKKLLIGINSLIHPLNNSLFYQFAKQMDDLGGIDFLYFTPVAPNLSKWSIGLTDEQKFCTQREFEQIGIMDFKSNMKVRLPKIAYKEKEEESYYLALERNTKESDETHCYVSLLSPALIPSETDPTIVKLSPCRASEVQDDNQRAFSINLGNESFTEIWNKQNFLRVQSQITKRCSHCYLERQFLDLKFMVECKRKYKSSGEFLLLFDLKDKRNVQLF